MIQRKLLRFCLEMSSGSVEAKDEKAALLIPGGGVSNFVSWKRRVLHSSGFLCDIDLQDAPAKSSPTILGSSASPKEHN
jgi:hypothetical protein